MLVIKEVGIKMNKKIIPLIPFIFLLLISPVSAYYFNATTNKWELSPTEFKDECSAKTTSNYQYNYTYVMYNQDYLKELSTNLTRCENTKWHNDWLRDRAYNNTVPIKVINFYVDNETIFEPIVEAIKGNFSDSSYFFFNVQNYTNTSNYNQTHEIYTTVMDCEAVPEIASGLRGLEIDYDRISLNSVKVVDDELQYYSDHIIDELSEEMKSDSGWSDKDYLFVFLLIVLIIICGWDLKKNLGMSKKFENAEFYTEKDEKDIEGLKVGADKVFFAELEDMFKEVIGGKKDDKD